MQMDGPLSGHTPLCQDESHAFGHVSDRLPMAMLSTIPSSLVIPIALHLLCVNCSVRVTPFLVVNLASMPIAEHSDLKQH